MKLAVCLAVPAILLIKVMLCSLQHKSVISMGKNNSIGKEKLNQHSRFVLPFSLRLSSGVFLFGKLENGNRLLLHPVKGKGDDGAGGSVKLKDHIIYVMAASSFTRSRTGDNRHCSWCWHQALLPLLAVDPEWVRSSLFLAAESMGSQLTRQRRKSGTSS